jgi:hypothetical protein
MQKKAVKLTRAKKEPKTQYRFCRDGKEVLAAAEYPPEMASHEDEEALVSDSQRKKVFCPGCADQDVALNRCHGTQLSEHLSKRFPSRFAPEPRGMLGIFKPEEMVALIDNPNHFFIGRRAPRAVKTKSIGVKKTLHHSVFANPFIVSSKAFRLGESLKLYERWLENGYRPLTDEELQTIVNDAPLLPHSIEDVLKQNPQLLESVYATNPPPKPSAPERDPHHGPTATQ